MLSKAKDTAKKVATKIAGGKKTPHLHAHQVKAAREYIEKYWDKLQRYHPKDDGALLGLPRPYLVPAYEEGHEFDFNELYYWDSYFMVQGMLDETHQDLVEGILEDLLSLQKRFKIIPNASRTYLMGRSQPPLLTSFIFDVFDAYGKDNKWLKERMARAQEEYETVWMGETKPHARQVFKGLSRYYDINYLHDLAEAESGWDMTPRFSRKALNYLPVDLNAMLYKYEADFARAAYILGKKRAALAWTKRAARRKDIMDKLMWSSLKDMYFDYNFAKEKRGTVSSLATYFPLWAGMVSETQAKELVKNLKKFENKGGLATTDQQFNQRLPGGLPGAMPTQWSYPNGWAPLHFIVVKGLQRYGYHNDAKRIALKWVKTNLDWFNRNHVFLEKYNVVQPEKPPVKGVYPSQTGFGWTNAIFERFCQEYIDA
jgi:alpha,alpha-trehalase